VNLHLPRHVYTGCIARFGTVYVKFGLKIGIFPLRPNLTSFFFVVPTIQVLITYEQVTLNARSYSSCKATMYRTLAASHGTGKSTVWNGVIWWDCILCTVGTGLMRSVLSIMALHQQLHEC
jgi:hypothetical protein